MTNQQIEKEIKKLKRQISCLYPYKVYTALLTQSGTDAPVATVLQNTLGGTVVWTRDGIGDYNASLTGAFTNDKTWLLISAIMNDPSSGAYTGYKFSRVDSDNINLETYFGPDGTDGEIYKLAIEIRVYY